MLLPMVARHDWSKYPYIKGTSQDTPFDNVVLSLVSNSKLCMNADECQAQVQQLEDYYVQNGISPNLPYSFVLASDRRVYEGRGYFDKPLKSEIIPELSGNTMEIRLLGISLKDLPAEDETMAAAKVLLRSQIIQEVVNRQYKLYIYEDDKQVSVTDMDEEDILSKDYRLT